MAHGYQIWIALPKHLEDIPPEFHHIPESKLPRWQDGNATFKLIAGEGYGYKSPVPVHSTLFMIEIKTQEAYDLDTRTHLKGEIGICVVEGEIMACEDLIQKGNILVSKVVDTCKIVIKPNSHILLFGGESFPEERHIYWNFVSSDLSKIEKAKSAWEERSFPMMLNDKSYVPLPS